MATIGNIDEREAAIDLIGDEKVWFGLYSKDNKQWRYLGEELCPYKNTAYKCIDFWGYRLNDNTRYRPRCIGQEEMGQPCAFLDGQRNVADNDIDCDTILPFLCNQPL